MSTHDDRPRPRAHKEGDGMVVVDGLELDPAGLTAAGDVALRHAVADNTLNSADRDGLARDTVTCYDRRAAEVVAAYLAAADHDTR